MADGGGPCRASTRVRAVGSELRVGAQPLFLNGLNLGWIEWGTDFDGGTSVGYGLNTYCGWEEAVRFVASNGGNALRVWMFTEPERSFTWADGLVTGLSPGVVPQALTLLELAAHYDVYVRTRKDANHAAAVVRA